MAKSTPWSTLWGAPSEVPKSTLKALFRALSGPGPWALLSMAAGIANKNLTLCACHALKRGGVVLWGSKMPDKNTATPSKMSPPCGAFCVALKADVSRLVGRGMN